MQVKRQGRPPTIQNARNRILDDAAALFAREGYDGTSLNDLAELVGVTKAGIYHYFPNKKEIYEAIIVRTLQGLYAFVALKTDRITSPDEALQIFMTSHAEFFEENLNNFLAMLVGYGGMENSVLIAEAQKIRDDYEILLKDILARGVADGCFRSVDIQVTSRAVLSMLNWMARWFKPGMGRPAASFASEYCDLILGGIRR